MTRTTVCPQCGAEIAADAPAGLCPKCLVSAGLQRDECSADSIDATAPSPGYAGFEPPPVEPSRTSRNSQKTWPWYASRWIGQPCSCRSRPERRYSNPVRASR